ncbi:MAG: cobalt ECF transporter T component CbiQ [Dictyoglomaceae bacterium]
MSNFIDKTLKDISKVLKDTLLFEEIKESFLSEIDERIKIISLLFILITISLLKNLENLFVFYLLSILFAFLGKINIKTFLKRTWFFIPIFTVIIAIPSIFLVPGKFSFGFTREGLENAIRLVLRVAVSISYVQILILTTSWVKIFSGLRGVGVPPIIVTILTMSYRYIFLLLDIAENLFLAKKSRTIELKLKREQNWVGESIGIMAIKTHELSKEVFQGMISRGFSKDMGFHRKSKILFSDILFLIIILFFSILFLFLDGVLYGKRSFI